MVKYIEPKDLADKLLKGQEKILIVDVRDSDYEVKKTCSKDLFIFLFLPSLIDGKD